MATLIPSIDEFDRLLNPLNDGELHVAAALDGLSADWTIYVQPRLGVDIPDFVAVHDVHGVCVIEVKDWAYGKYPPKQRRRRVPQWWRMETCHRAAPLPGVPIPLDDLRAVLRLPRRR